MSLFKNKILTKNQFRGLLIYPIGDGIAQLIIRDFNVIRFIILALVGCFLYAYEIGKWFTFIQNKFKNPFLKAFMSVVFFNPLWIARHFLFIELAINFKQFLSFEEFSMLFQNLMLLATRSFFGGIIVSYVANYLIQNKIPLKNRFLVSAIYSALMGVYYALSKVFF